MPREMDGIANAISLIHRVLAQLVLILTVIVVLRVLQVGGFGIVISLWAQSASRLVDTVVDARVAYALATAVVEPPVARGAHALAGRPTLVPGNALRHERDRTVYRHHVRL